MKLEGTKLLKSSSNTYTVAILVCALIFPNLRGFCAMKLPTNVTVPGIFVFGDSIVDSGNNNYISTLCKSNFPPYGRDFPGGQATGRFSDGIVPSDIVAQAFGDKKFVPAYLDASLSINDMLTGVNFASACSGYLPLTATYKYFSLSLENQLDLFKQYVVKVKAAVGEERTTRIISQSIFIICTGSNDFLYYYETQKSGNMSAYTDSVVNYASGFLKRLYDIGARRIVLGGAPPQGCLPAARTNYGGLLRFIVESFNQDTLNFNLKLQTMLKSLQNTLQGSRFIYFDFYYTVLDLVQKPHDYGFEVVDKGCCGTGLFEEGPLCNIVSTLISCPNASKYVFWDASHPTQAAYNIIVARNINQTMSQFF
ncbi:GDSL esterase/lipase-like protein [Drosera capensis]